MEAILSWPVFRAQLGHRSIVSAREGYWQIDLDESYLEKNQAPHDWSMIGLRPRQVPTSKPHIEWALAILMTLSKKVKGDL